MTKSKLTLLIVTSVLLWLTGNQTTTANPTTGLQLASLAGLPRSNQATASVSPMPTCQLGWQWVDTPNADAIPEGFAGASAVSANDVWGVGNYEPFGNPPTAVPLAEHWDGSNWSFVPVPHPNGEANLVSIVSLASNDVWAVGTNTAQHSTLAEHWNGTAWNVVASPSVGGLDLLHSVSASSSTDIWAVGSADFQAEQTLIEHWDGTAWSVIPSANVNPQTGQMPNSLYSVVAVSANNAWAVGYYAAADGYNTTRSLVEHWDGSSWQVVDVPHPGDSGYGEHLWAVAARAANDVWAVGEYVANNTLYMLAMHWDGSSWRLTSVPFPGTDGNGLRSVVALAPDDVWAVGDYFTRQPPIPNRTLVEHWDGRSWQIIPSPSDSRDDILEAVTAVSSTDVWALGDRWPLVPGPGTIALHYAMPQGCGTQTPTSTATLIPTSTPSATPPPFTTTPEPTLAASSTPTSGSTPPSSATATPNTTATPTITATPQPSITPTDCANPFVDINANIFYAAIHQLNCAGVINGTDANHYTPAGTATRGQFAKIVVLGFGLPLLTPTNGQTFTDVPASYFAYLYVESGYHAGILSGYDPASCAAAAAIWPCYLPNLAISRAQLTKLVVGAAGYPLLTPSQPSFSDVPPTNVFYASIETAHAHGVVNGYPDGTFRPNRSIRRDEMAGIVYSAR